MAPKILSIGAKKMIMEKLCPLWLLSLPSEDKRMQIWILFLGEVLKEAGNPISGPFFAQYLCSHVKR